MKKNITINLMGRLYQIDEDAYQLLQSYTDSLRSHFATQQGGEEIVDDIESRIAELFDELKAEGIQAITIEHVQKIMIRIGNPEQMDQTDDESNDGGNDADRPSDSATPPPPPGQSAETFGEKLHGLFNGKKRLFRDTRNKMLTGLMAGLSNYFGGDVTFWRVAYVLLVICCSWLSGQISGWFSFHFFIFNDLAGFLVLAYIVLSIIMPAAKTPEDRLRMQGKPVNPQNLAEVITEEAKAQAAPPARPSALGGCLSAGIKIVAVIAGVMLMIPLTFAIVVLILFCFSSDGLFLQLFNLMDSPQAAVVSHNKDVIFFMIIGLLAAVAIPIYCLIHALTNSNGRGKSMGVWERMAWLLAWMISVGTVISCGVMLGHVDMRQYYESSRDDYDADDWSVPDSTEYMLPLPEDSIGAEQADTTFQQPA